MDLGLFEAIGLSVQNTINDSIAPIISSFIYAVQMIAITGVTLYIVITGYAIMTGAVESPVKTFIKQCVTYQGLALCNGDANRRHVYTAKI